MALQAAAQGHQVLAISRQIDATLQTTPNIHILAADLSQPTDITRISEWIAQHWKQVDVLLHNAGALLNKSFADTSVEDFLKVYQVNVFGVAALSRACLPYLKQGSHVVAISSMGGVQGSAKFAGLSAYSSSKAAVIGLMELLAEEWRDMGISCNSLALGAVQTEMLAEAFPGYEAPTTAEEMAAYILQFGLEGHRYFNGKVLPVSKSTP